ncbi:MAG: hypothetical protein U0Y96_07905 [Candidatus Kapaibacterium sp.]
MKCCIIIVALFCSSVSVSASVSDSVSGDAQQSHWLGGLYPFSALAFTLKPEVEYRPSGRWAYLFSPEIKYSKNLTPSDDYYINANKDTLSFLGLGGVFSVRYYTSDTLVCNARFPATNTHFYIFGNTEYHHYNLEYPSKSWIKYNDGSNDYYLLENVQQQNTIQQYGAALGLGMLITVGNQLFFDMYTGYNVVISKQNPLYIDNVPLKDNLFYLNKLTLTVGFKVGLVFK